MSIELRDIQKSYAGERVLKGVDLEVRRGELVALVGPSGSGKTTLLRILAGLETPDGGELRFFGEDVSGIPPRHRRVGFVFQHYALFKHMTVFENVAFGLRVRPRDVRPGAVEIRRRVSDLLELVQLEHLGARYPSQLSGGQRQRVALARTLAVEPRILLLDEPFGALDPQVRKELRRWVRTLHLRTGMTTVFVTHDQEEALEVADRVVVMNAGRVEQVGTPLEVHDSPATPFVIGFFGQVNRFEGTLHQGKAVFEALEFPVPEHLAAVNQGAVAFVRPHEIRLSLTPPAATHLATTVRQVLVLGTVVRLELEREGSRTPLFAEVTRDVLEGLNLKAGDSVYTELRRVKLFPKAHDDYSI